MTIASAQDKAKASSYIERCTVCGHIGELHRHGKSIRETYRCANCDASLRYREQAGLILKHFSRQNSGCIAELAGERRFRRLRIYEPGLIGPFRKILRELPGYRASYFWDSVEPGAFRDGVQCQDLMRLTFNDNTFDLVLSSDIFEHVRKPFMGFKEIDRVLKPGGFHIFSIPMEHPMPDKTMYRVDTSGHEDVPLLPERYHGAPIGGRSLVYTDFGADMAEMLEPEGIELTFERPSSATAPAEVAERMFSFYWQKRMPAARRLLQWLDAPLVALANYMHRQR